MNKRNAILAVAVTAVATAGLMGGLAIAAGPDGNSPTAMPRGVMMAHFGDRHDEGRRHARSGSAMMSRLCDPRRDAVLSGGIAYVEASLKLTPEQTAVWQGLTAKINAGSEKIGENCASLTQNTPSSTSLDRLAHMEQGLSSALTSRYSWATKPASTVSSQMVSRGQDVRHASMTSA